MRDNPSTFFARTFHPDEANQAFTTGRLLETGRYEYRPDDHHGPTLYYAAAAIQKAAGHNTLATLDGTLLRCTPLLFAVLALVFGFLAIRKVAKPVGAFAGWLAPCIFALLLGTSPIFAFFATDFIQEMLLACFSLMMFWAGVGYVHAKVLGASCLVLGAEQEHKRESNVPSTKHQAPSTNLKPGTWALFFGIAAGLAFATKETSLITFAAAGLAGIPLAWRFRKDMRFETRDAVLALAGFALTAILFYSSFAANWQGVYNAFIAAPLSYLHRAAGDAASTGAGWHVHPWWQYLKWLFADEHGFLAFFIICGTGMGLFARFGWLALRPGAKEKINHSLMRTFLFALIYAFALLALYSSVPYKTPWCALQMHTGLLLAALLGFAATSDVFTAASSLAPPPGWPTAWKAGASWWQAHPRLLKAISAMPLAIAAAILLLGNTRDLARIARDPDSKDIPYNYASASPEVQQLAAVVANAMAVPSAKCLVPGAELKCQDLRESNAQSTEHQAPGTEHQAPFIAVALPPADTWPFPWYNRPYEPQTGYWTSFDDLKQLAAGGSKPTVVIVPMTEGHLVQPLFPHLKHTKRFYMRHGVRVRVFW